VQVGKAEDDCVVIKAKR